MNLIYVCKYDEIVSTLYKVLFFLCLVNIQLKIHVALWQLKMKNILIGWIKIKNYFLNDRPIQPKIGMTVKHFIWDEKIQQGLFAKLDI